MDLLAGGAVAIFGGLAGALATGRGERDRWRRDTQLRVSTELLSSLQQLIRRIMRLAYLTEKPTISPAVKATALAAQNYFDASASWNGSIYAALLVSPPKIAKLVQELDREVDRLLEQAMSRPWSQAEFREQRRALGRIAAKYLNASRAETGWRPIHIESIWSWDRATELSFDADAAPPNAATPDPDPVILDKASVRES